METARENLPERKGPPPIPEEAKRRAREKREEKEISLESLIAKSSEQLERESNLDFGEADLLETAEKLGLGLEDLAGAKKAVGYEEKAGNIFSKLKETLERARAGLNALFSKEKEEVPETMERSAEDKIKKEVKLLDQEAHELELTNKKIVGGELAKLKEAKAKGAISPEEYKQKRAELAEARKFQYLVRMEQAIRDAEAFVLQNPDAPPEEIIKAVTEAPGREVKLNATQKKAVERAAEKLVEERRKLLDYTKELALSLGVTELPPNPLDILEGNQDIKKKFLEETGFGGGAVSPEDITIHTDFPLAVVVEFKKAQKVLDFLDQKTDRYYSKKGLPASDLHGFLLVPGEQVTAKTEEETKKYIKRRAEFAPTVLAINGESKTKKATKIHELQHVLFNNIIKGERARLREPAKEPLTDMESRALDELTAYLKEGRFATGEQAIFSRKYIDEYDKLSYDHPLKKTFGEIKNEFKRLEAAGVNAEDIYTLAETSDDLKELSKRIKLIPAGKLISKKLIEMLDREMTFNSKEMALWLLNYKKPEDIILTPDLINKIEDGLINSDGVYYEKHPSDIGVKILKDDAKLFEKLTGKKPAQLNKTIEKIEKMLTS